MAQRDLTLHPSTLSHKSAVKRQMTEFIPFKHPSSTRQTTKDATPWFVSFQIQVKTIQNFWSTLVFITGKFPSTKNACKPLWEWSSHPSNTKSFPIHPRLAQTIKIQLTSQIHPNSKTTNIPLASQNSLHLPSNFPLFNSSKSQVNSLTCKTFCPST